MIRVLLPVVLLCACATAPKADAPQAQSPARQAREYYPLEVGNRWRYEVRLLGSTETLDVSLTKLDQGAYVDSMGNRLSADAFGVRDEKRYLLREPLVVGTTWTNVVSVSSVERYRTLAVGESCEVPAGHFDDCVVIESTNRESEGRELVARFTFARGVGLAKVAVELHEQQKQIPQSTLSLTAYGIKGPGPARFGGALPPQP